MATFKIQYVPHATSREVFALLNEDQPLTDAAALAVASWYQSARGYGYTFAMLASTGTVITNDLRDSIRHELAETNDDAGQVREITALAEWLEAKCLERAGAL